MITDDNRNYDQNNRNFTWNNENTTDPYQQERIGDEDSQQEQFLEANQSDNDYLDNEFSNALERDDQDDLDEDFDDSELEEDDLEEDDLDDEDDDIDPDDLDDDLVEDYDENDREPEPETFADDSLKVD
ncbi:hypothetical protein [Flavobacterium sp. GSB-24]|uniref:hypothetical protein n=1 Tax=Flavobacterium sp. GSB-24 TaxID=2994319 RepID=UPI002492CF67|nr:hypothetical protein [Flavobacterium sp. GSB-24]BDU26128.1 hypothetical protein FLGSB24_28720 [Flavobacterium sp. GSB-24]